MICLPRISEVIQTAVETVPATATVLDAAERFHGRDVGERLHGRDVGERLHGRDVGDGETVIDGEAVVLAGSVSDAARAVAGRPFEPSLFGRFSGRTRS